MIGRTPTKEWEDKAGKAEVLEGAERKNFGVQGVDCKVFWEQTVASFFFFGYLA